MSPDRGSADDVPRDGEARTALLESFAHHAPGRMAQTLLQAPAAEAGDVLAGLSAGAGALVVATMPLGAAAPVVGSLPVAHAAAVCRRLELPLLANLLRHLGPASAEPLVEALPVRTRKAAQRLLSHAPDRVGAHMEPRVVALPQDLPSAGALDAASDQEAAEDMVFVVDSAQRVVGWVRWPTLLRADPAQSLGAIVDSEPATLAMDALVEDAIQDPAWARISTLPVVDSAGRLVGALRHGALMDALGQLRRSAGPDPTRTARELGGLYSLGLSALWEFAAVTTRSGPPPDREGP